jgi:prevent-host-death family protein
MARRSTTVGAYEAKTRLSALLDLVEGGHEIVITKHERPVAKLVPFRRATASPDLFERLRGLRGRMMLRAGETAKSLIDEGRRI